MGNILYPVGNQVNPVGISCGQKVGLLYPVENISCGQHALQDIPTGYNTYYILWVYPVGNIEFYRCCCTGTVYVRVD